MIRVPFSVLLLVLIPAVVAALSSIELKLSPLIGGPSFLPIHCKVVVAENIVYDFVPIDPLNIDVTTKLLKLQAVPGEIRRTTRIKSGGNNDSSQLVAKADNFVDQYANRNLQLLTNNCWTFALQLSWYLMVESKKEALN